MQFWITKLQILFVINFATEEVKCFFLYSLADGGPFGGSCQIHGPVTMPQSESEDLTVSGEGDIKSPVLRNPAFSHSHCPPEIHKSCFCVRFIAEHTKMLEDSTKVLNRYKFLQGAYTQRIGAKIIALFRYKTAITFTSPFLFWFSRWKKIGNTWRWC